MALRLPADVSAHADRAVAAVRDRHPDLRWVPASRWHVTLAFYGEIEDRSPFRAHVTVARLRGGLDPSSARSSLAGYTGPEWLAGTVRLVRSRTGAAPAYDDVATWPLAQRP